MSNAIAHSRKLAWPPLSILLRSVLLYIVLIGVAVITAGPFMLMLYASFQSHMMALHFPLEFTPERLTLDNYQAVWSDTVIGRWFLNSILVTTVSTLGKLFFASLAGYAFARGNFPGRDLIFWILMSALMVPETVSIVPVFLAIAFVGWVNTYQALILPGLTGIFSTFIIRQYTLSIPRDYDDAARVDGASPFGIWWYVIVPMTVPALVVVATFQVLGAWNDFLYPLIVTNSETMRTLTVGLATMVVAGHGVPNVGFEMAAATVGFIPALLFYLLMQRHIVQGFVMSGVKG